jgi:hypothetical protein
MFALKEGVMDRYSKCVLSVIAAALVIIAAQQAFGPAVAQMGSCGVSRYSPCYVELVR